MVLIELEHPSMPKLGDVHADIVLVHGLMGHYIDTWKAVEQGEDKDTVWPIDLLPQALHQAGFRIRVLSFKYGGSIMSTSSQAGIDDTANDLMQCLYDKREDQRDNLRPIIFVGHSLGGVIVKRAIRIANNVYKFRPITKSILGVLFFATIQKGNREEYRLFLRDVLKCHSEIKRYEWLKLTRYPSDGMYKEIEQNPGIFEIISQDFVPLFRNLSLKTFQEGRIKEPLQKVVVNQALGTLGAAEEECIYTQEDHLSLCKFKKHQPQGTMFHTFQKRIGDMIRHSPWQKANRLQAINLLCSETLCQSMMINEPASGTGDWIFKRPQYQEWLDMKSGKLRLWITGEPGCGKSYLAKNIVDTLRKKDESVICAFLREPGPKIDLLRLMGEILQQALEIEPRLSIHQPLSQGVHSIGSSLRHAQNQVRAAVSQLNEVSYPAENNLHGLLASTIRQVLVEIPPKFVNGTIVDDMVDKYLLPLENPPRSLQLHRLQELWPEIMDEALTKLNITAVIDGFDKMERQDQLTFLKILAKFPSIRLLFLSADYSAIDSDLENGGFIRYCIDKVEDTGSDIKASVTPRMGLLGKIHGYPSRMLETIEEEVPKAADGLFLRAELILGSLKRTKYDEDILNKLLATPLQTTPLKGTVVLYDQILGNLLADTSTRRSVQHVLAWITFQLEALSPAELGIARALAKARDDTPGSVDYDQVCNLQDDDTELWVNRFLGHLIKLQNNQFGLIHPSLMRYLITKPEDLDEKYGNNVLHYHADSYMDPAASHALLGNLCATYLAQHSFAQPVHARPGCETWFPWQAAVDERMREHKFFRYAALHWSEHLRLARNLAVPGNYSSWIMAADRKRHQQLEDYADSWMEVRCYFHDWHKGEHTELKLCSSEDNILHRPYVVKQSATEETRRSSPIQADKTEPGTSGTARPNLQIESTASPIKQAIPKPDEPTLVTRSTPQTETANQRTELSIPPVESPSPLPQPPTSPEEPRTPQTEAPVLQQQGTATPPAGSSRQAHWIIRGAVRGAEIFVNKFGLDDDNKDERSSDGRSTSAPAATSWWWARE